MKNILLILLLPLSIVATAQTKKVVVIGTRGGGGTTDTSFLRRDINLNTSAITTKLNITDTANIRLRAIAGTNTTITGTYPNLTFNASGGTGTVSSFSAGTLSPLFTTSVANSTSTPALSFSLTNAAPYTLFGRASGTGAPSYLTSIDSNYIPALHSENYYNSKYAPFGGGGSSQFTTVGNNIYSNNTGNVGIGIGSPAYKLDVAGSIRASSGGSGVAYWVPDQTAIRGLGAGATMYIDAGSDLNGNFIMRGSSMQTPSITSVGNISSAGAISASSGFGYAINGITLFNLKVDSTVLRINDNAIIGKVGIRGNNNQMSDEGQSPINWTFTNNALLELKSTTRGFLTPRMTTAQRDAIATPAEGLEIYNLTSHAKEFFNGTVWKTIITN